jgi:hypothetical protein
MFELSCPILAKTGVTRQAVAKLSNIKFRKNPFRGSGVVTVTDTTVSKGAPQDCEPA